MELWCLPNEQPVAQVESEPEDFIKLWLTVHQMLGNHRYYLITHSHVHRNSCSLAFELICTQFKGCLWKLRGTMPWEQSGREELRRMGSGKEEERQRLSSPLRATSRRESGRHLEHKEAARFPECGMMLSRGKGKAGHERAGGENGWLSVGCVRLQISMGGNNHRKVTFNGQIYTVNVLLQGL